MHFKMIEIIPMSVMYVPLNTYNSTLGKTQTKPQPLPQFSPEPEPLRHIYILTSTITRN